MTKIFRPWGEIDWLAQKIKSRQYIFIGCLSTEDRFLGSLNSILPHPNIILNKILFLEISDPPSQDSDVIEKKINENKDLLHKLNSKIIVEKHHLLQSNNILFNSIKNLLENSSGKNVILDISCFPKRFFFPIIKILINVLKVENLIVLYATPLEYYPGNLTDDPMEWEALPLFLSAQYPEPTVEKAIVSVGFMPLGLPRLLGNTYNSIPVSFLLPFPPGPPNYQRTWNFMLRIEKSFSFKAIDSIIRIDSNNLSDSFDRILSETNYGKINSIFAPYGPKPISLSICLYAIIKGAPVYYTQPKYYAPNYSKGTHKKFMYLIKINGKNLYEL